MKTYKSFGLKMTRAKKPGSWYIDGQEYQGNKGTAFMKWLLDHAEWTGTSKGWIKK